MLIQSISGIRGIYPTDLNGEVIARYVRAFHRFLPEGTVVVGRDSRPSGNNLISVITDTLITVGRGVMDCGICPTPTIQFVVDDTDSVGGIVVTASHNPEEWNGLKFIVSDGCFLNKEQFSNFLLLYEEDVELLDLEMGSYSRFDQAIRRHLKRILSLDFLNVQEIKSRQFKVAVDTVNSAASEALPLLMERLGCKVVKINCDFSGKFARGAEPLPENLHILTNAVKENGCDVGFATDPDGDRLAVMDEVGNPLGEEYTLVIALDDFLRSADSPQTVVTNLSTTLAVDNIVEKYQGVVKRSAVGEINVVELMKQENAMIGGEGNGGVILRDVHLGRDSLVAASIVLNWMVKSTEPLSAIFTDLPQYKMLKEKVSIEGIDLEKVVHHLQSIFQGATVDKSDGAKFTWENRWIHLRKSNTEPIVRIYVEGPDRTSILKLVNSVKDIITQKLE